MAHRSNHCSRPSGTVGHHVPDIRFLLWISCTAGSRLDRRVQGYAGFDNNPEVYRSNNLFRPSPGFSVQRDQSTEERNTVPKKEYRHIVRSGCLLIHYLALQGQYAHSNGRGTYKYRSRRTHRSNNYMHRCAHIQKCRTGQR